MDQMKGMGVAPHLNPAFLQEMAAQGNAGAKGMQNMVGHCVVIMIVNADSAVKCTCTSGTFLVFLVLYMYIHVHVHACACVYMYMYIPVYM